MSFAPDRIRSIVAYVPYPWHHAVVALRVVDPLHFAGIQLIRGNEGESIHPEQVSLGDAVLIQREFPMYTQAYEEIVARARDEGKPIVYETDDFLLELPEEHPDHSINYYTPALFPMLRALIEADLVTTSTPILQTYLRSYNPNITVLPNYLDDRVWSARDTGVKEDAKPLVIGYMGSITHKSDLESLTPLFLNILERYKDQILLRFWGAAPPAEFQQFPNIDWQRPELYNYSQFAAYFSQQDCDIFISPLNDTFFNRCKSPIKFFEYSVQGIPGVYSHLAPYERVVIHGENGYLASTLDEWETCLCNLIENPTLRHKIGHQAQQNVIENWTLSQHAHQWDAAYQSMLELSTDAGAQQTKQEYARVYVKVARQVQAWYDQLHADLAQKDQTISDLRSQLANRDQQLDEITTSSAWSIIQWLWKVRIIIFPHNSQREKAAQKVMSWLRGSRA